MIERLNLEYRWNPRSSCLEAKYDDEPDEPHNWKVSLVPSVQAAIGIPGEIEAMIKARDDAATAARPAYLSEEWMDEAEQMAEEDPDWEWGIR